MSDNVTGVLTIFIFWGWIPILSIGKAIAWCIEARRCNKCTYMNCLNEEVYNDE